MSDFTEALNINKEDALNVAQSYEGYASAVSKEGSDKNLAFVASSWLISALYQSLLDTHRAKELFALAADCFFQIQSPLWRLCEICAQGAAGNRFSKSKSREEDFDHEDFFYRLLQQYDDDRESGFAFYPDQNAAMDFPLTGRVPYLNIPYQLVIEAMNEVDSTHFTSNSKSREHFSNLIGRLRELISLYQIDEYRWRNVQGPILPFEPAALAITIVLVKKWCSYNTYEELLDRLKGMNTPPIPLLQIAYEFIFSNERY
ncbi:hypothetical protein LJ707_10305 [Mucilaginibacter sp. UR6-1]|uniref:hypothetical protein n=1 Tax=Mucilaginibacter sp. UR6-1 TaxID=1435643 RepID=UPI001E47F31E|nr:hypothetical protein [Mucilaginibacter sp. UR6-1]MCC8409325.1 hypothetical protein [Mucilaginibacter sp. UR6-1]